jgi:cytochrome c553
MRALLLVIAGAVAVPSALAADATRGGTLYQTYCAVCHGFPPSGGPEIAPNNPALIQAAINGLVPQMGILRFLTPDQVADIAAYLGSLQAPPPPTPPPQPPAPSADYTDLWWGGDAQSGWGFNLIQHPSHNIFAVMYTYDTTRRPLWFVLPGGTWTSTTTFSGNWYRVTGPAFNGTFDPSKVSVAQVGTAQLSFTDENHATLAFTVNGVTVSHDITRLPF